MIGLLILATELVKGTREKVRDRETQSPTPETSALPGMSGHRAVMPNEIVKSLNRSITK